MKSILSRAIALILSLSLPLSLSACGEESVTSGSKYDSATRIELSDSGVSVNGKAAASDENAAVYTAHDIVYYEAGRDFTYGEGTAADAHDAVEAEAHTVVHITQPGVYFLTGKLSAGQIAVDLGKDAKTDPNAVVELVFDNVDITCTVAPAIIFYSVYECDEAFVDYDEDDTAGYEATHEVDTSAAGAVVTLLAGTENSVNGSYVARIYKPESVELNDDGTEVEDAKKLHKYDGALYSKMSMVVSGEGKLTINAENEGLDSELHLTINGGDITINAGNDGINTNEDEVSVTTINGGSLTVNVTGETGEGDGIDSNGWIVINGGTVKSFACAKSMDSGLDADMGIFVSGGTVVATGNMYDRIDGGAQNCAVFAFAEQQAGGETYALKNAAGETVLTAETENAFRYLVVSAPTLAEGEYTLWCGETQLSGVSGESGGGMMGGRPFGPQELPEGLEPDEIPERPEGMEPPEGFEPDEIPERPEGMEPPEGFEPDEMPERPEGMEPPEGFEPDEMPERPDGERPDGFAPDGGASGERTTSFAIGQGVSFFSAVSAEA